MKQIDEDALRTPCKQARKADLAQGQRQPVEIDQEVKGAKLDLIITLAGVQCVEVRDAIDA
jgi:hypothetical protein